MWKRQQGKTNYLQHRVTLVSKILYSACTVYENLPVDVGVASRVAKLVTRYCNSAPVKYSTLYSLFYIENSVYSIVFARLSWRSTIVTQALSNPRYGSDTISEVVAALQQHLLLCSMVIV